MLFQNIARAKFREVLRNETDVLRRFSVLFTSNSSRSPRVVTFSVTTKSQYSKLDQSLFTYEKFHHKFTYIFDHNVFQFFELSVHL